MPIPEPRAKKSRSIRSTLIGSRLVQALISIIAPELMLITAITESINAQDYKDMIEETLKLSSSLAHAFPTQIGGFCVKTPERRFNQLEPEDSLTLNASRTAVIMSERRIKGYGMTSTRCRKKTSRIVPSQTLGKVRGLRTRSLVGKPRLCPDYFNIKLQPCLKSRRQATCSVQFALMPPGGRNLKAVPCPL